MDIILLILMLAIPGLAQLYVSTTYKKFQKIRNDKELTGYDVARKILDNNKLEKLYIVETKGKLSDHYDSSRKTIRLSKEIYHGTSIASLAIAAHECGHAIQDKEGYFFLKLRAFIFPTVNLGTKLAYVILIIGLILEAMNLIWLAILLVGLGLFFQLVTLPVEFDASKKAKVMIEDYKLADKKSIEGVNSMLNSAAMTYVAGVLASAIEILRLILIFASKRE